VPNNDVVEACDRIQNCCPSLAPPNSLANLDGSLIAIDRAGCGKSTFAKQLKILYTDGTSAHAVQPDRFGANLVSHFPMYSSLIMLQALVAP